MIIHNYFKLSVAENADLQPDDTDPGSPSKSGAPNKERSRFNSMNR